MQLLLLTMSMIKWEIDLNSWLNMSAHLLTQHFMAMLSYIWLTIGKNGLVLELSPQQYNILAVPIGGGWRLCSLLPHVFQLTTCQGPGSMSGALYQRQGPRFNVRGPVSGTGAQVQCQGPCVRDRGQVQCQGPCVRDWGPGSMSGALCQGQGPRFNARGPVSGTGAQVQCQGSCVRDWGPGSMSRTYVRDRGQGPHQGLGPRIKIKGPVLRIGA
jgi:hypothetical protein